MYDLDKNLEYLIISFFGLTSLTKVPAIFAFLQGKTENLMLIYGGTAIISILMLYAAIFSIKYITIPFNILIGKQLNKLV